MHHKYPLNAEWTCPRLHRSDPSLAFTVPPVLDTRTGRLCSKPSRCSRVCHSIFILSRVPCSPLTPTGPELLITLVRNLPQMELWGSQSLSLHRPGVNTDTILSIWPLTSGLLPQGHPTPKNRCAKIRRPIWLPKSWLGDPISKSQACPTFPKPI